MASSEHMGNGHSYFWAWGGNPTMPATRATPSPVGPGTSSTSQSPSGHSWPAYCSISSESSIFPNSSTFKQSFPTSPAPSTTASGGTATLSPGSNSAPSSPSNPTDTPGDAGSSDQTSATATSGSARANSNSNSSSPPPVRTGSPTTSTSTPKTSPLGSPGNGSNNVPNSTSNVNGLTTAPTLGADPAKDSSTPQRDAHTRSDTGAIAGGVAGGVVFVALVLAGLLVLRRWLRARRTAPSAEFMHVVHRGGFGGGGGEGSTPIMTAMRLDESTTPSEATGRLSPFPYQRSFESHESSTPPAMAAMYREAGSEKVYPVAEDMHQQCRPHGSYASSLRSDDQGDGTRSDGHSYAEEKPESAFGLAL
ncbi:hypothetical protein FKP32DRAFT_620056 [Trametes sanguinea]|nr:hypothetical protein FKP32DRAFT_620056 [Trametes sanguinea]